MHSLEKDEAVRKEREIAGTLSKELKDTKLVSNLLTRHIVHTKL